MADPDRVRVAAALIADTLLPAADGMPSASDLGTVDVMLSMTANNPRDADRKQLDLLLKLWNTRTFGVLANGRPRRFADLSQADREAVLLSLAQSRLPQKRALFAALRFGLLVAGYSCPGPTGTSPLWARTGYAPPFGVRPDAPPRALQPLSVDKDTELSCDVVIVGSGAGGGTAAGVLAAAGLDVVVLEAGQYHDDADMDGAELTAFTQFYAPAPTMTAEGQIAFMQGYGVGGGTVVNYTTSFRTPDDVREQWAALGAQQFAEQEYGDALDAVCTRLGVNTNHDRAGIRDAIMERGLEKLGWHVDAMPRNVIGCEQDVECGRCGLGCRIGAKQSTAKTWLVDAHAAGARIYVGTRALKVTSANGRATGVEAVSDSGAQVVVRARAVVVAAGSLQTPALLRRSGLGNRNIGKHLRLHPATAVWGRYDEDVLPWTGPPQSRFSKEHRDLDGEGYGVIYETAPITAAFGAGFLPWHGAAAHAGLMKDLGKLAPVAVIVRDRDPGEVKVDKQGEPVAHYKVSPHDAAHLHRGIVGAAEIAEAAGATEIFTTHARRVGYTPGRGSLDQFATDALAEGYAPGRLTLAALHIMGTARMGGSPEMSAINPDGETWDLKDLVVADGSCFPTASGVNPMISIESIAYMNATRLAARLTK
ncbi:oxidoreductase [Nocardioides humilatus]|uniref:Oxidoreductase n=1 Tax=Nocardioides humilatus TaxID=2607660 RepID=A0A5B1LEZ4_9ACTN|nr:GMC family oxidoreductase N-terminal domain-containing protein [Nocardioides humilatus]KAA1419301.1 oxidoreductase [Nocardioides humilatus]